MTTNVEPPRAGVVGGGTAGTMAGAAPGITTTPGVSKKEPVGERGRESHVRTGNECAVGKSWRHARDHLLFTRAGPTESCEFASASKFGWASWDRMALTWGRLGISRWESLRPPSPPCGWAGKGLRAMGRQSPLCYLTSRATPNTEETAYRLSTQVGNYFLRRGKKQLRGDQARAPRILKRRHRGVCYQHA